MSDYDYGRALAVARMVASRAARRAEQIRDDGREAAKRLGLVEVDPLTGRLRLTERGMKEVAK